MKQHILAIDQGTTSSRAMLFDRAGRIVASAQRELQQFFPADGWVEHDPEHIWTDTVSVCREVLELSALGSGDLAAIGITNQRETTVLWNRRTGRPVHKAIVWQDRRTADFCRKLALSGFDALVSQRTGLILDPYFSGTKLAWLLDNVPGARASAERGDLAFGTVDSFLLWRLTGGKVHATDASNASRTMLFDIERQAWDEDILAALRIPSSVLPDVRDSAGLFGETEPSLLGTSVPVMGIAGDQQAATFGQACFRPGMIKSTYGTGCFALVNTGSKRVSSRHRLLTTVAWRLDGEVTYALEGSIFVAGAAIQWVRDGLHAISHASESRAIAASVADTGGVYLVPAFTGLGAPWWDPDARGAILGLTRDSTTAHIVRAALEAVCYQTFDLMAAMDQDMSAAGIAAAKEPLRVDGGMVANDWLCQYLADVLDRTVDRPAVTETTALGAAGLAGLAAGLYPSLASLSANWQEDRRFEPAIDRSTRTARLAGWHAAIERVRSRG